ncbi:IucA/IucC family protein [Streptomyces sp. NPDC058274]|uniref:IucA/IucC family protein n=1 Tax=Streptomyces sp. NPDC058274 TaxID=3346416 RepID=UPI0036EDA2C6
MNATPASDGQSHAPKREGHGTQALPASATRGTQVPPERQFGGTQAPPQPGVESVPRQRVHASETDLSRPLPSGAVTDPLEQPDPYAAAQAAAVENLLRCWVRENDLPAPDDGILRIPLPATATALLVPVRYWSSTGWHRFGLPCVADAPEWAPPADAVTVATLLAREAAGSGAVTSPEPTAVTPAGSGSGSGSGTDIYSDSDSDIDTDPDTGSGAGAAPRHAPHAPHGGNSDRSDLTERVADSLRRTVIFVTERREHPGDGPDLFLAAEQALLLGHPLHPTPKSREGLSEAELRRYSPETRGSFPLHWMSVAPELLASDSAWTERGRPVAAAQLTARLAGTGLPLPEGHAALPLHPWQAREIRHRPDIGALFDAGLLQDLGPHGPAWHPTSSVRTLYRSGAPAMLKLSLGLRITNSRRENLRKELHRGVEVHRLLRTGLSGQWRAAHPGFDIVRDPAWLAVTGTDGRPAPGLDVMIRHNPFGPTDDVSCIAGFVSPRPAADGDRLRPAAGGDRPRMTSRLAEVITRLAGRTGRARGAVAAEWFLRYLQEVVRPVLWLDSEAGIALEAHQQNTLLLLDPEGWPAGGRYRDNQGYYFRASRRAELDARLPGIGEHSDTFVSDEVTDERFAYYLAINNVLGLIGAFGSQRLADERLLLAAFRRFLTGVATGPDRLRTSLPAHLLDSPHLRCKANLLTRLHGLDELIGPVDTQSVYVTIANPLHP